MLSCLLLQFTLALISCVHAARLRRPSLLDPYYELTRLTAFQLQRPRRINVSFEEAWGIFRDAVPPDELQETCKPSLLGPVESEKLVILLHGFTSCPIAWDFIAPAMVSKGYRVMLPTLPGHGRLFTRTPTSSCIVKDGFNESSCQQVSAEVTDDLSEMPMGQNDYKYFAKALLGVILAFYDEKPKSQIVLVGHSLGGTLALYMALEQPKLFNRVLFLNPFLGPSSLLMNAIKLLPRGQRMSFTAMGDADCEATRDQFGGYCQFLLGNVGAMLSFATDLYCERLASNGCRYENLAWLAGGWVSGWRDYGKLKERVSHLPAFQMVATAGDLAVDNTRISAFVHELNAKRAKLRHMGLGVIPDAGLCYLPAELDHNYFNLLETPERDFWWIDFLRNSMVQFLTTGVPMEVVEKQGGPWCLPQSRESLHGDVLASIPATQHSDSYQLATVEGSRHTADVVFHGTVEKESERLGFFHDRQVELLAVLQHTLIVTRLDVNEDVRDIFLLVGSAEETPPDCIGLELVKLGAGPGVSVIDTLLAALKGKQENKLLLLNFCSESFVHAIKSVGHQR